MAMIERVEKEKEMEIKFAEIEKQCQNWRDKGYKIMVVYQPITNLSVATEFYKSMLSVLSGEIWEYMADKHKIIIKPYINPNFPIDSNRNMAVLDARDRYKADYMFFMDTDQTFPPMTIPILYEALIEKQKQNYLSIMAGMYFAKKDPWPGVFGLYSPWDEEMEKDRKWYEDLGLVHEGKQLIWWKSVTFWSKGQIFPVDVIGAGCMMMPVAIFEALKMPFFKYLPDFAKEGKMASEDMWFCAELKKNGIPIYMNSNVSCGHLTQLSCDESLFVSQRDGFYKHASIEKRRYTYGLQTDVRNDRDKSDWQSRFLKDEQGDE